MNTSPRSEECLPDDGAAGGTRSKTECGYLHHLAHLLKYL